MFGANGKPALLFLLTRYVFNFFKSTVFTLPITALGFSLSKISSSHLHKHQKWVRKIGLLTKIYRILCFFCKSCIFLKSWIFAAGSDTYSCFLTSYGVWQNINSDYKVDILKYNVLILNFIKYAIIRVFTDDSVLIRKNTGQWKNVYSHILCSIVRSCFCVKKHVWVAWKWLADLVSRFIYVVME